MPEAGCFLPKNRGVTLVSEVPSVDAGRAEIASKKEELAEGQKKLDKQRDQLQKSEKIQCESGSGGFE